MHLSAAALLACLLAGPSPDVAADPAPTTTAYPLSVRVTVPPESARRLHHFTPPAGNAALAVAGSSDVEVGRQAEKAFGSTGARMFHPAAGAAPAGELQVTLRWTDVLPSEKGWYAEVELEAVLRDPGGAEVGRWRLLGQSVIVGAGSAAVPSAFARATQQAADTLEVDFEAQPPVVAWLAKQGVAPGLRREALPILVDRPTLRPLVVPVRPTEYLYADFGLGLVLQGDGSGTRLDLRGGWARRWLFLQGGLSAWQTRFAFWPIEAVTPGSADAWNLALALDAGVQRVFGAWAVAVGAGAQVTRVIASGAYAPLSAPTGFVEVSGSSTSVAGNLFVAGRYHAQLPRYGIPYHLTLELRRQLGGAAALDAFGTTIPSPDLSILLLAGVEFPRAAARPDVP